MSVFSAVALSQGFKRISLWLDRVLALPCNAWKTPYWVMVFLSNTLGKRTCSLYIFSPFFFGGCIIRLADCTYFSFIGSVGGTSFAQVLVQVIIPCIVNDISCKRSPNIRCRLAYAFHPAVSWGNSRFGYRLPICFPLSKVGNGVENDVILCIQSWVLRLFFTRMVRNER